MNLSQRTVFFQRIFVLAVLLSMLFSATAYAQPSFPFSPVTADKEPLAIEKAFRFQATQRDNRQIQLDVTIEKGYYLYADRFHFAIDNNPVSVRKSPKSTPYQDDIFGAVSIYRGQQTFILTTEKPIDRQKIQMAVTYQGCADLGICYPLDVRNIDISVLPSPGRVVSWGDFWKDISSTSSGTKTPLSLLGFWLLGLLMAATPCIFPLIPVVLSLISAKDEKKHRHLALLGYWLGFVMVYAALAFLAAQSGQLASALFQSELFLILAAIVYLLLGLSMFGLWSLGIQPQRLTSWLNDWSQKKHPALLHGWVIGLFSALLSTPCITPPLAGSLLYIAQTGDSLWGMMELGFLATGLVFPMGLLAIFGRHWLPKSGRWMVRIQRFLGIVLFGMAINLLSPILPNELILPGYGLLFLLSAWVFGFFSLDRSDRFWVAKTIFGLTLVLGCAFWLFDFSSQSTSPMTRQSKLTVGQPLDNLDQLAQKQKGRPALLFFTAEWCRYCPDVARLLASTPDFQGASPKALLLVVDLTQKTADNEKMVQHFQIFGPPTLLLLDGKGRVQTAHRLVGQIDQQDLNRALTELNRLQQRAF